MADDAQNSRLSHTREIEDLLATLDSLSTRLEEQRWATSEEAHVPDDSRAAAGGPAIPVLTDLVVAAPPSGTTPIPELRADALQSLVSLEVLAAEVKQRLSEQLTGIVHRCLDEAYAAAKERAASQLREHLDAVFDEVIEEVTEQRSQAHD